MILYHGSNVQIDIIDLEQSRPNKDFGKGFYLSDSREQAMEMAAFKVSFLGGEIIINEYDAPDNILQ